MNILRTHDLDLHINQKWFCRRLNAAFFPGEVWGILGPNGSGKTTLLQTLAGLRKPEDGDIYLAGQKLASLSRKAAARIVGILLQDSHFTFNQTVRDYCAAARFPHLGFRQKKTAQDLRIIDDALKKMELNAIAHESVMKLSGGEKRRLAAAALIAQTPRIYLLDEPSNHLDIHHQMRILSFFQQQAQTGQALTIMSLHDVNLAQRFCDNVLLMFGGGEILQGRVSEILTAENVSRLYQHPMTIIQKEENVFWIG